MPVVLDCDLIFKYFNFRSNYKMEIDTEREQVEDNRWNNLQNLLSTTGPMAGDDFEPHPEAFNVIRDTMKLLVIGAGGLGCELLKDLAMTGFKNIDVIDMDTIDLSNLNRQFLFRAKDIGQSKAVVAAAYINNRVPGCNVKPHFCKIQDFGQDFYADFHMVICGLDSVVARRWINGMLLSLLQYDDDGVLNQVSMVPLIDGGTEGFKGNARIIMPGISSCIECNLDLYPQQVNYPMCTIAETPRLPEHCIEYVKVIQWPSEVPFGPDVSVDGDDPNHISWIYEKACERSQAYGIGGVTYLLTKGVIKNIIPAVASTNAVIAAMCTLEVIKVVTSCYKPMNNYIIFNDSEGVHTYIFEAEKKEDCSACSQKPVDINFKASSTLQDFVDHLKTDPHFQMSAPGITTVVGEDKMRTLYIPNIPSLEQSTRKNLEKTFAQLEIRNEQILNVTDVTSPKPVLLRFMITP